MRRIVPPLAVAILALAAGCADTTSPATRTALSPSALIGNPPPPPSDTSGSYSYSSTTTFGTLYFNAIYFVNPTEKAGFIHFNTEQPAGVIISPDASIDYHLGTITGTGTITAPIGGGTLNIDLTKVSSQGTFNPSCSGPVVGDFKYSCASVSAPATFTNASGFTDSVDGGFTIGVRVPTNQ